MAVPFLYGLMDGQRKGGKKDAGKVTTRRRHHLPGIFVAVGFLYKREKSAVAMCYKLV